MNKSARASRKPYDSIFSIPPERLGQGTRIRVEIVETEDDIYHDFARVMFNEIRKNNAAGKLTVFILPVGPVGQYKRLARLCNLEGVTCENLVCVNMDEYCTDDGNNADSQQPEHYPETECGKQGPADAQVLLLTLCFGVD